LRIFHVIFQFAIQIGCNKYFTKAYYCARLYSSKKIKEKKKFQIRFTDLTF